MHPKTILLILDGFGIGGSSPYNAIENASTPFYRHLLSQYPHAQILTHGEYVGLPPHTMGNSEVGHLTMGSGQILPQDLTRISQAIQDQSFFTNPPLCQFMKQSISRTSRLHLMGLLSNGGVHSHLDHLLALLDLGCQLQVPKIYIHVFLDGRDTPPNSSLQYLKQLLNHPAFSTSPTRASLVSLMGRYWSMDRDQRWDRIERAYHALTGQIKETPQTNPLALLEQFHAQGTTDEFIPPVLFKKDHALQKDDSVIFFNFRSDRARSLTEALIAPDFRAFNRTSIIQPNSFLGMTDYYPPHQAPAPILSAFPPQTIHPVLGELLEEQQLSQLRIAETEKYPHVTFFFNGGRELPFQKETRYLIPSPRTVATYDLQPAMSADLVTETAIQEIQKNIHTFILINFANADMVGHTGNYQATRAAIHSLDCCLEKLIPMAQQSGYTTLLTSDHGNAEEMQDSFDRPHTQHTLNPVPIILIPPQVSRYTLNSGSLKDIFPTLCELMNLPIPKNIQGISLLKSL